MKNLILVLIAIATNITTNVALADSSDDFHALIVESAEARQTLRQKLKKSVEIVEANTLDNAQHQQKVFIRESEAQVENVVSPSHGLRTSLKNQSRSTASQDNSEIFSQEIEESRE